MVLGLIQLALVGQGKGIHLTNSIDLAMCYNIDLALGIQMVKLGERRR